MGRTGEMETRAPEPRPRVMGPGMVLAIVALLILLAFGYCASKLVPGAFLGRNNGTTITNDVVVSQIRAVAKLVSSEATVRDVIVYENTWYGSTKRSLVVVTGRLLAGIDLKDNPEVSIDDAHKRITIRIPHAKLIALEVREMRTYDERGGLWNPFTAEDRDAHPLRESKPGWRVARRRRCRRHAAPTCEPARRSRSLGQSRSPGQ